MSMTRAVAMVLGLALLAAACAGGDGLRADAGADFSINVGESPRFDACSSGGDVTNYMWTVTDAPTLMEGDAGKVIREIEPSCSFTLDAAMGVQEVGSWVVELTVSDDSGATSTDTVTVEVTE